MQTQQDVTRDLTTQMALRGIRRVPGASLAFERNGRSVGVEVLQSVYRGHVIAVGNSRYGRIQFRARGGAYDWHAIAASVEQATASGSTQAQAADAGAAAPTQSPISIKPSPKPGHVRVRVSEIDLDPVSMMQLYALVRHALPRDESPAFA